MADSPTLRASPPQTQSARSLWRPWALWGILALAGYAPLLIRFGREQWGRPQYQFYPLMLIAAIYFAWQRAPEAHPSPALITRRPTTLWFTIPLILFLAALTFWSGRLAAISAWSTLAAIAWYAGRWSMLRAMFPSGLLLALVIGPPLGSDEPLLQHLRELAVWISSGILMLFNTPHLVTGTVIEIPGSRLLVAEACSGINSLMAVLGCTLVLCFWRRRSLRATIFLLAAGVLFVLWANVARIAGGAWLQATYSINILSGDAHELASIVLFLASIALVFCTDEAVSAVHWWLSGQSLQPASPEPPSDPSYPSPAISPSPSPSLWLITLLFALLGIAQVTYATSHGGLPRWLSEPGASHLRPSAIFTVPKQVGLWQHSEEAEKQIVQPEIEGKRSCVWAYRQGDLVTLIAIDYPFAGYHDLTICYQNGGWTIDSNKLQLEQGAYRSIAVTRLNERGYIWFSALNEQGEWAEPPKASAIDRLTERLHQLGRPDWNGSTYQVQAWVHGYGPLTPEQQSQVADLFLAVRADLARQLLTQLEAGR